MSIFLLTDVVIVNTLVDNMARILMQLEKHTGLGPTKAAKLLGVAYNTYAQYSSGRRVLPLYIERCARLVMLLDKGTLLKVIDLYVHGKKEVDNLVRKGSKDE